MADIKWTEEQLQAINENSSNILVAAAAGSGKTAVLVERIINKVINENVDIDKILVMTFTNAAASEIRERILDAIYKRLEQDPENSNLQRQINLINKANISTIHSFCLDVIRNNFYEIDIPNNFRVADVSEIELLKYETIEEIFEEKYLNNDEDFTLLVNTYTGYRGDEDLENLVLDIYKFIQSNPFPEKWIKENAQKFKEEFEDFGETLWGKTILNLIKEQVLEGLIQLKSVEKELTKYFELEKYSRIIEDDISYLEDIIQTTDNWDKTFLKLNEQKWISWIKDTKIVNIETKEYAKGIRDKVKDSIKDLKVVIPYDSKQAYDDMTFMYNILSKLKDLVLEFSERFLNKKKEKNIVDFNDIEHFALNILLDEDGNPSMVAKKYQERFNEIDIDEYQDSNLVQEYILNSVSKGDNIFMVGDVKQSIYKFRQARPELFVDKYLKYDLKNNYDNNSLGLKIQLFKNFRSRKNILDLTNMIFENIMSENIGEIKYDEEEYLNYSANFPEPEEKIDYAGKTEIHIINVKQDEETEEDDDNDDENEEQEKIENTMLEAKFVAKRINELLNSEYMVYDKKQKEYRHIEYRDIVILLRATQNRAEIYEKELNDLNLPVFSDSSTQYIDSMEIQLVLSILKVINNPIQDIPLVTVLRSVVGNFTDNDLLEIRLVDRNCSFYESMLKAKLVVKEELKIKIDEILELFDKWRKQVEYLPLDELIWQIYTDTNILNMVGVMPNGAIKQANLKTLFEKAKEYESASLKGLFNFINFIDRLKDNNGDFASAKLIGENENVIRIMSIHKSKGLEFPVVVLAGTGKKFNMMDLSGNLLLHQDLGIGPRLINTKRLIQYDTLAKHAIRIKAKLETLSEEERILYVALTRAKEKLIITGISKDVENRLKQKQDLLDIYNSYNDNIDYKLVKKYSSYLDWIELVYLKNKKNIKDIVDLKTYSKDKIKKELIKKQDEKSNNVLKLLKDEKQDDEEINRIKELLDWKYEFKQSGTLPTKAAVTDLKQNKIAETKLTQTPKFLEDSNRLTAAQKGTLIHLCVQKLNEKEEYSKEKLMQFVEDLFFKEIITKEEKDSIDIDILDRYTKSDLWNRLKTAKEVHKEQPFYINIPAKEIYDNIDTDDKILVQGIIDLYYISNDNKLVLVDYKTDHIYNEEELKNKYNNQLMIYKTALEKSLKRKVDETYIYSTTLGKLIFI